MRRFAIAILFFLAGCAGSEEQLNTAAIKPAIVMKPPAVQTKDDALKNWNYLYQQYQVLRNRRTGFTFITCMLMFYGDEHVIPTLNQRMDTLPFHESFRILNEVHMVRLLCNNGVPLEKVLFDDEGPPIGGPSSFYIPWFYFFFPTLRRETTR